MVNISRRHRIVMNSRKGYCELIFWIPMGILSLIYLLNNHHTAEMTDEIDATIVYKLVENTTDTNQYSDSMNVLRYVAEVKIEDKFVPISVMDWSKQLISSDQELIAFSSILANSPMKAFFFETKGVNNKSSYVEQFEFVLVESSYLYAFADDKQDEDTNVKKQMKKSGACFIILVGHQY